ncbi:MAG: transposase, partial [Bacteroidota bacterium]|nr:transposase [Bacteroidota bacterium]
STLSDAYKLRTHEVFEHIYNGLLKKHKNIISDRRILEAIKKKVKIFDSTTISLFVNIPDEWIKEQVPKTKEK